MNADTLVMENQLAQTSEMPITVPEIGLEALLKAATTPGMTNENAVALEKYYDLYERMQAKKAEREFTCAFVQLQGEMPKIEARKAVPNKDGSVRYHYAPFEDIMTKVGPILKTHGFVVTFSTSYDGPRLISECTLSHISGHSKTNKFAVRIGSGPPSASEAQADGSAATYAKRRALGDCLNIVVGDDTDARAEGGPITQDQVEHLKQLVVESKTDTAKFLKFAHAMSFETIGESRYLELRAILEKRVRGDK